MLPEVPYAFVSYKDETSAERAYNSVNGKSFSFSQVSQQEIQLYLSFMENVPKVEMGIYESCPPGLILIEDFVTEEEERKLLECLDWDDHDEDSIKAQKTLKHRKVKHYGYEFIYGQNNVDPNSPLKDGIPEVCGPLIERLYQTGYIHHIPDQLTVNCYEPGQGIPPHVDTHSAFEDGIVSFSLQSQVVMNFKHPDGRHSAVVLPARSVLIMTGESRYMWTHGITPRKSDVVPVQTKDRDKLSANGENEALLPCDKKLPEHGRGNEQVAHTNTSAFTIVNRSTRTSFTFRKVLLGPCKCAYPDQCDSQNDQQQLSVAQAVGNNSQT